MSWQEISDVDTSVMENIPLHISIPSAHGNSQAITASYGVAQRRLRVNAEHPIQSFVVGPKESF